jgi:CRP-like cAMP-binding protein
MDSLHDIFIRKLKEHTSLSSEDAAALCKLPASPRPTQAGEELVRQGDDPNVSLVVVSGMLARYHTLGSGVRQYLSFHIAGDWPDAQGLFLDHMDHAVGVISPGAVAVVPHRSLLALFERRPTVAFAIWRETLIDAAIFREAITNNSRRDVPVRLAHFLCEQYYRAFAAGLTQDHACDLPLSQTQLAESLASSLTTINRAMRSLRRLQAFELRGGRLHMRDFRRLARYGEFDPAYLHLRRAPRMPAAR